MRLEPRAPPGHAGAMRAPMTAPIATLAALCLLPACLDSTPGRSALPVAAELDGTRLLLVFPDQRRCLIEALPATVEGETWYGAAPRCDGVDHVSVRYPSRPVQMPDGSTVQTLEVPPDYLFKVGLSAPNRPPSAPVIEAHVETTAGAVLFTTPEPAAR